MLCPHCGSRVSRRLHVCPYCGAPVQTRRNPFAVIFTLLLLLSIPLGVLFAARSGSDRLQSPLSALHAAKAEDAARTERTGAWRRADDVIPGFSDRYYLSRLDQTPLSAVCLIYEAAEDFAPRCVLPDGVSEDDFFNLFFLMEFDCPELLQLDFGGEISYTYDETTGFVREVMLPYRMDRAQYASARAACELAAETLAAQAEGLSDYEKELLVYDHLTQNCLYDTTARHADNAYGALVLGRAKCDGIAYAAEWLLRVLDVPCLSVAGYPAHDAVGHAWNLVKLDGVWYGLDITPDIPEAHEETPPLHQAVNVSDELILAEYPVLDDAILWFGGLPKADSMARSWYVLAGRYLPAGDDGRALLYDCFSEAYYGSGSFSLQFESADEMNALFDDFDRVVEAWMEQDGAEQIEYTCWTSEGYNVFYAELRPVSASTISKPRMASPYGVFSFSFFRAARQTPASGSAAFPDCTRRSTP